jgi:LacI family transcriptional regulator
VVLVLDTANPYQRKIVRGVATYMHQAAHWSLHVVHDSPQRQLYLRQDPLESLPDLRTWQVDGILAAFHSRRITRAIHAMKIPVVGIEPDFGWLDPSVRIPCFATDNHAIGRLGAEDLIARGFTRLAFCGIPRSRFTGWAGDRAAAFQECARQAGLPCSIFVGRHAEARQWSQVYRALLEWLESLEKPVGLMACYDIRARHVLEACRTLGLVVPEEVAVIGVDNDEMLCELSSPTLSSIEQGARNLGFQAAALLDRWMAGEEPPPVRHVVEPESLVTRRSSDTLAIEDADVANAVRFIRRHACEGIQVGDVVRSVGMSRSALETRFKTVMNRTIHAEIQRVQIEHARHLVATSDLPLKQIALRAGFRYVQYMTTVFRQHTGRTPAQYRKQLRG